MDAQRRQQCIGQNQQGGEAGNNDDDGCGSYNKCCTRWKPTFEQLQILRDLYYNQMVRRPSTEEIERISLRLRQLGRIEGKNVFYWFQNQRNRERHPRKRPAAAIIAAPPPGDFHNNNNDAKRSKPPETLSLFPMHNGDGDGDSVFPNKQDGDGSQFSLELSLRPYFPTP